MARASDKSASIAAAIAAVGSLAAGVVGAVTLVAGGAEAEVPEARFGAGGAEVRAHLSARVAPPPLASTTGTTAPLAQSDGASGATGDGVWALVVGVDDYPGSEFDLRAGVADAREVDAALDAAGVPASQRRLLLDDRATAASLWDGLEWLVGHAGPEATAVVFFSGHVREVAGDEDGDGEQVDEAMVLADGRQVFDGEMAAALDGLRARRTWIGVAACYGGGFDDVVAPGRVLTAAAPEGELAYENDRFGRTYLVEYMVRRAMVAGTAGSIQEAFSEAMGALSEEYPNRVPVMFDRTGEPLRLSAA